MRTKLVRQEQPASGQSTSSYGRRLLAQLLAVAMLVTTLAAIAVVQADDAMADGDARCERGEVCIYDNGDFGTTGGTWSDGTDQYRYGTRYYDRNGQRVDNTADWARNRGVYCSVTLFARPAYGHGPRYRINQGNDSWKNLGTRWVDDDTVSSHDFCH